MGPSLDLAPKTREEQYEIMIANIMAAHGCGRGKARRIIESIARKETKKFIKEGKRRQEALRVAGKLMTSEELLASGTDTGEGE